MNVTEKQYTSVKLPLKSMTALSSTPDQCQIRICRLTKHSMLTQCLCTTSCLNLRIPNVSCTFFVVIQRAKGSFLASMFKAGIHLPCPSQFPSSCLLAQCQTQNIQCGSQLPKSVLLQLKVQKIFNFHYLVALPLIARLQ